MFSVHDSGFWRFGVYLSIIACFSACVDTIPIIPEENEKHKIFVECELKANEEAQAFVSLVDYVNSGTSGPSKPNEADVYLSLGEFQKEEKFPFEYNFPSGSFMLYHQTVNIRPGKLYSFRTQYKDHQNPLSGIVEIPNPFAVDSIVVIEHHIQQTGLQKWKTSGKIRIYPANKVNSIAQYLHLDVTDSLNVNCPIQMNAEHYKFFRLTHRPGVLLKLDGVQAYPYIEFSFTSERNYPLNEIKFSLKNTSPSYYEYQKFKSNSPYNPSHSHNPAIAAFNLSNDTGYGSLMATNETVFIIDLK